MKSIVIQTIEKEKLIVILRNVEEKYLLPLSEALYQGGIRLMEITYDASGKVADETVAKQIRILVDFWKEKILIGAGTVLTEKQVELTKEAGGLFIISPNTDAEIIRKTNVLEMVSIPGALTPTEVQAAHRAGADFVKLFPMDAMGASYLKAVKAPLSHIKFLAVGGIDCNNMEEYLKAGAIGFGIGSSLIKKELLKEENYAAITELAEIYVK
ncbi:MAG: bifunctional 4-hydroxy-2-oxoglutarate aldolase/2-dehydro-3-deoxy-phosphogluconate aldolase, partial [Clostridia bacterium]|nr:bifunctional 4-hydroxy-2-oxoglutarate aldolase/2-dehydro-3-deoxy-phosphogluconate aldolase [Clostridia bacterium]